MSRRSDTPVPQFNNVRTSVTPAERASTPFSDSDQPPQGEWLEGIVFATPDDYRKEERRMLDLYRLAPGKCPRCGLSITHGVIGHLSKCLRTSKFKVV